MQGWKPEAQLRTSACFISHCFPAWERSRPALLLSTVSACCAIVLLSLSLSACSVCVCVCIFFFNIYFFFFPSLLKIKVACLAFKFSGYLGVWWRARPELMYWCFSHGLIWLRAWGHLTHCCPQSMAWGQHIW